MIIYSKVTACTQFKFLKCSEHLMTQSAIFQQHPAQMSPASLSKDSSSLLPTSSGHKSLFFFKDFTLSIWTDLLFPDYLVWIGTAISLVVHTWTVGQCFYPSYPCIERYSFSPRHGCKYQPKSHYSSKTKGDIVLFPPSPPNDIYIKARHSLSLSLPLPLSHLLDPEEETRKK